MLMNWVFVLWSIFPGVGTANAFLILIDVAVLLSKKPVTLWTSRNRVEGSFSPTSLSLFGVIAFFLLIFRSLLGVK